MLNELICITPDDLIDIMRYNLSNIPLSKRKLLRFSMYFKAQVMILEGRY